MSFVAIGLFVLACGWNFYRQFHPTRASALRNEGHPQYFGAALSAGYIAFLSIFLHAAFAGNAQYSYALNVITSLAPENKNEESSKPSGLFNNKTSIHIDQLFINPSKIIENDNHVNSEEKYSKRNSQTISNSNYTLGIAVALWSAMLGMFLACILNLPFRYNGYLGLFSGYKSINNVEKAIVDASFKQTSIAITLTSGKVYIGPPKEFDPNGPEADWISIWPLASGYRKSDGSLELNTSYSDAYEDIVSNGNPQISPDDFTITLPLEQVVSIQSFKLQFYIDHFLEQAENCDSELGIALQQINADSPEQADPSSVEADSIAVKSSGSKKSDGITNQYGLPSIGVPLAWLESLKWIFHLSVTAAIVSMPFSLYFTIFAAILAFVSIYFVGDSANEKLAELIESAKEI